jgi:hypothetical protein
MGLITRILHRRRDLANFLFCYLCREIHCASGSQPERQFPINPGPARGAFTPSRTIRRFRVIRVTPSSVWPARAAVKKPPPKSLDGYPLLLGGSLHDELRR